MDLTGIPEAITEIRPSPIHGAGVFARRTFVAGSRIMAYSGETISKAESLRRCEQGNNFIFALDKEHDLDGNVPWNPARLLNHSCAANCEVIHEGAHLWIVAAREIVTGEELTFNYGYDLVDYREHPYHCGARECAGFIVAGEFFEHVRTQKELRERQPAGTQVDTPTNSPP